MHLSLRGRLRVAAVIAVLVTSLVSALVAAPVAAQPPADTIGIIKADESPSNAEIAVRLSEETPLPDTSTVVIGRDDEFADSLASGVLQSTSPLLLVPRGGPVPERVRAELVRLAPQRVLLLGGVAALEPAVEEELRGMGFAVERRAGPSRFETATVIAGTDAAGADTAILARAFPAAGATDPTQGFADALAAGGMAAEFGWPVLLTQTEVLTGPTREYLVSAGIRTVKLMGGTAAISQAVEDELVAMGISTERLAGGSRAETAVEVAKARGADSAADAAHVVLVQGQTADAWAGGFAAAAHSALLDAPIVLAVESQLPPATVAWLEGGAVGGAGQAFAVDPSDGGVVLTCVTAPDLCEDARIALGLPPALTPPPQLISVGTDDRNAGGELASSDDTGTTIAFVSSGTVVPGVDDGRRHVYVARIAEDGTATYELVDVRPDGTPATRPLTFSEGPTGVSADGRYVAFTSPDTELDSDGLTAGFLGGSYLRDMQTGTTRLVSFDTTGEPAAKPSDLAVNDDGTVVSYRAQLDGGGGSFGIAIHDLTTGEVTAVTDADGQTFFDSSGVGTPALSGDGSTVAFYTDQPLVVDDTNEAADTYVFDVAEGRIQRLSVAGDGREADAVDRNDDGRLGISRDGQLVVFASDASNLTPGLDPASNSRNIFLHDRGSGTTTLVSRLPDGTAANSSAAPTISRDGRFVAFATSGDITASAQGRCGTYRWEIATDQMRRLDLNPLTGSNNCPDRIAAADTGVVVFGTNSSFTPADEDTQPDVYRSVP
ncbi:hypothetical protein BH23ACT9_BH23ACT9_18580 [soil metagenome]